MKKMNDKGFSLIELIIVIAIMAVLVAVIAPNLTSYLGSSKKKTDNSNADTIENAISAQLQTLCSDEEVAAYADPTSYNGKIDALVKKGAGINGAETFTNSATALDYSKAKKSFEKLVYDNISKYVTGTTGSETVKAKQAKSFFWIKITGTLDEGYTVSVKVAEQDPFGTT